MTLVTSIMAAPRIPALGLAAAPAQSAPEPAAPPPAEAAKTPKTVTSPDPVDAARQNLRARALLALVPVPVEAIPWLGAQVDEIRAMAQ
ncbi:MAG: hypothetical protein AAF919_01965 [Pseudomonadota bacterium]